MGIVDALYKCMLLTYLLTYLLGTNTYTVVLISIISYKDILRQS